MNPELTRLQGCWRQVDWSTASPDEVDARLGDAPSMEVSGQAFEVRSADGSVVIAGTFSLDASTQPGSIDWTDTAGPDAGSTFLAIYRLSGETFEFCAADEGAPRPVAFTATGGHTLRRFRRAD